MRTSETDSTSTDRPDQDLYAPQTVNALFYHLYPTDYFNPFSSPARIYEAVRRTRALLDESGIALAIVEENGNYRLQAKAKLTVLIPGANAAADASLPLSDRLRARWPGVPFTVSDAASALNMPRRTLQRSLEALTADGTLVRTGRGKTTRYQIASKVRLAS